MGNPEASAILFNLELRLVTFFAMCKQIIQK